jgi:hypothetical protein
MRCSLQTTIAFDWKKSTVLILRMLHLESFLHLEDTRTRPRDLRMCPLKFFLHLKDTRTDDLSMFWLTARGRLVQGAGS